MVNSSTPQIVQLMEVTRYDHSVVQLLKSILSQIIPGENSTVRDLGGGKIPMYLVPKQLRPSTYKIS